MRQMFRPLLFLIVTLLSALSLGCKQTLERTPLETPAFDANTLGKMKAAELLNLDEILAARQLDHDGEWLSSNPYQPRITLTEEQCQNSVQCRYMSTTLGKMSPVFPARSDVYAWWSTRQTSADSTQVCGLEFIDDSRVKYRLKTFPNLATLRATPGFYLTHFHGCGSCSSLQDLAIYGELDLTKMAKTCSKRMTSSAKKSCMREIGLSEACAETWAYNATSTGQSCAAICIKTYGLIPLILGQENVPPSDANGNLNPCVLCDEVVSGPGFQYAAGRTRRDSGIISEISRPEEQVYEVAHDYFYP